MNTHVAAPPVEEPRRRSEDHRVKVSHPVQKFLIGFIAGFCAAIFPRLTAQLLVSGGEEGLAILSPSYLICSAVFASTIGAVIMIMEWHVPKEPRVTFMAALGIPAIITGSFNTLDSTRALTEQMSVNARLVNEVERTTDLDIIRSRTFEPLGAGESSRLDRDMPFGLGWIPEAAADDDPFTPRPRFRLNPSIKPEEARYVIVLDRRPTQAAAVARAGELSESIPAQAIATDQGFLIIKRAEPTNKADALIEALRIREATQLQADVLELR